MQILILAGGIAKRLRPVTKTIPKGMVDVGGKPFLERQIGLLKKNGIKDIVLAVGYRSGQIKKYFGNGSMLGVRIRYSNDGPSLLGTGGAVKKAQRLLDENFMVIYGDAYLDADYKKIFEKFRSSGKEGLMTVYRNRDRHDKSNVIYKNREILRYDKKNHSNEMDYIDYGLLALSKKALKRIPPGKKYDLADLQKNLVESGLMAAYEVKKRFYEIGSFSGLKEFRKYTSLHL